MEGTSLTRLRWRLRGAWMWPSFIVLTLVDGVVVSQLPPVGDSASAVSGWLIGMCASLVCIVVLAPPLAFLLRRVRTDMPRTVARDYTGTVTTLTVTAALLAVGIVHHQVVTSDSQALTDAVARAEGYIGEHAPSRFQANLRTLDTFELQPPRKYVICDTLATGPSPRSYCVAVDRDAPFAQSVRYAGSQSNTLTALGTN